MSFFGRQLTIVASALQIFLLTDSSLQVGLLSLAQLGPVIVCSFVGGSLADAVDRRKLLIVANVLMTSTSIGLAVNAMLGQPQVWPLYVCTALNAGFSSIDAPTRTAAVATLVRRDQIPAAAALNQTGYQLGQVAGPAFAGLIIALVSTAAAYWFDVATFVIALVLLFRMRAMVPEGGGTRAGLTSVKEGLRYLSGQRAVQGTFLIDINAMVFGMPRALFPQLGTELYGGGAGIVGLLYAAPAAGALLGAVTTGWVGGVRRPGRAVLFAVVAWGASIAAFGVDVLVARRAAVPRDRRRCRRDLRGVPRDDPAASGAGPPARPVERDQHRGRDGRPARRRPRSWCRRHADDGAVLGGVRRTRVHRRRRSPRAVAPGTCGVAGPGQP